MKKYLHLGYPKNFSTSLQRNYFAEHKDIYHLGIGIGSNIAYIDDLGSALFEVYLKSAKGFKYNEQRTRLKEYIETHFSLAISQNKTCFGASSEHFSFGFTYDSLEFESKISRVVDLMGSDINFILIIRNQFDMLKSLYRESVRVGLPGSFSEFIYGLYKFQDRNYVYDLRYDLIYSSLLKFVPQTNIHFLVFEDMRGQNKKMIKKNDKILLTERLSQILGIDYLNIEFEHFNEALSDEEILIKSELNKSIHHDLGRNMYFSAEIHRQNPYFKLDLNLNEPEEVAFQDVLTKRKLIRLANEQAKFSEQGMLRYDCDPNLLFWFSDFYTKGNFEFIKNSGILLPNEYFNMKF